MRSAGHRGGFPSIRPIRLPQSGEHRQHGDASERSTRRPRVDIVGVSRSPANSLSTRIGHWTPPGTTRSSSRSPVDRTTFSGKPD
jgi:hypothetical protein